MGVKVGDIWKRRVELHDELDVVRVCGRVWMGEGEPDEFTITPANEFGEVVQTSEAGITEHCDLVTAGSESEWTSDVS
jgi:hypothetical protein